MDQKASSNVWEQKLLLLDLMLPRRYSAAKVVRIVVGSL